MSTRPLVLVSACVTLALFASATLSSIAVRRLAAVDKDRSRNGTGDVDFVRTKPGQDRQGFRVSGGIGDGLAASERQVACVDTDYVAISRSDQLDRVGAIQRIDGQRATAAGINAVDKRRDAVHLQIDLIRVLRRHSEGVVECRPLNRQIIASLVEDDRLDTRIGNCSRSDRFFNRGKPQIQQGIITGRVVQHITAAARLVAVDLDHNVCDSFDVELVVTAQSEQAVSRHGGSGSR